MAAIASQRFMPDYQVMRARQRAWQAQRISGRTTIEYVEVFPRFTPHVVDDL